MLPIRLAKTGAKRNRLAMPFERRLLFFVLAAGFPGVVLAIFLLWANDYSLDHQLEGTLAVLILWMSLSFAARNSVVHSIRVLSNVVLALEEEDFSFRSAEEVRGDALGDLAIEINELAQTLETERLKTLEAANLLRKVMSEGGAMIFAFSSDGRLRLLNRPAEVFLGRHAEQVLNRTAQELGLEDMFQGPRTETISRFVSGVERRWIVRRTSFRQHGVPHRLIVFSEASEALRAEQREASQKLIRVLSHEINNSLAPIKSIARSLSKMSANPTFTEEGREDLRRGLQVIGSRAESLNRFVQNYTRLARLPLPTKRDIHINELVARVINIEARVPVTAIPGPDLQVQIDPDQLEQALINLIRNAADAVLSKETTDFSPEAVTIAWQGTGQDLRIWIRDEGIGLIETENLFVPFYTTKESGSGIGLALSRQIIEGHNGSLTLRNRGHGSGCEVEIILPDCIIDPTDLLHTFR